MLRHYITQVCGRRSLFRPRIMVCVPSGITTVEKRAVMDATQEAGARRTYLIEEPLAAALGAGLDISAAAGSMVVDIGGGTADVAVLSLNGIVTSASLRVGGDRFDEAIIRFVKRDHNMLIGERTAEDIKIQVGTATPEASRGEMEVRGRDLVSGLPKTIVVSSRDTFVAMEEALRGIVDMVHSVMERTPPELAADILDKGLVLTGGGALLHGLDALLARETGVPVLIAEDPLSCVVLGTGKALESLDLFEGDLVSTGTQ
jgi:rod shape-determining protein MreB